MKHLKYCPNCGQASLEWDYKNKIYCNSCGFVLYNNTAAAVAVVIQCGEELFFTVRNQEPGKGKLDLAGGFSDPEETSEETCARELREELGVDISPDNFRYLGSQPNVYPYKNIIYNTMDLFFLLDLEQKFDVQLEESEVSAGIWISKDNLELEQLAFESQKRFMKKYLNQ